MRGPPFRPRLSIDAEAAREWRAENARPRTAPPLPPNWNGAPAEPPDAYDPPGELMHVAGLNRTPPSNDLQKSQELQPSEAPRPLRRETSPAESFPTDALGDVLGGAARAIVDKVRCADALACSSVLAAACLTAQSHADVVIPATGSARPLSIFLVSVAATGDRKSAADHAATWSMRQHEKRLREQYETDIVDYRRAKRAFDAALGKVEKAKGDRHEIEAALRAVGDEPDRASSTDGNN